MVIAIDGPAGSGKSTVAKIVADKMNFIYVDTGAMYRAITLKVMENGLDWKDTEKILELARKTDISFRHISGDQRLFIDGKDASEKIRTPEISKLTSEYTANNPGVREILVSMQRAMGKTASIVMEGRDIGSVVFPNADKKFFLDCEAEARVTRRYLEFTKKGIEVDRQVLKKDILKRDQEDISRKMGPLVKVPEAFYIDTSKLTVEQVAQIIISVVKGKA